ncbi:MAG TPA: formimidoylglutamate deiminase [Egibacteraceae bacterium]|nr:formimidoylglutamate deiminase [Egibacteraceae bacterium]
MTEPSLWHAQYAVLDGRVERDVLIETARRLISSVTPGQRPPPPRAQRLAGLVIPGLANAHSHAFHRALRGRAQRAGGDFWSWRALMYQVAERLNPETYRDLARAVYAEMALAGITAVGEFHYLHHDRGGRPYSNPNAMAESLITAAGEAGIRLTLLDTCYLRGGFGRPLEGPQLRFGDADAEAWAVRASAVPPADHVRRAAAIHSVRAVDEPGMKLVRDWAAERGAPLHVHVSEQPAENDQCRATTGRSPVELLADHGVLGAKTTAVHATHLAPDDIALLGGSGASVCLCPTTERDLADGVGPASSLAAAGARLCLGSDSHAVIDLFEEARAVELDERLTGGRRGIHRPEALLRAATAHGMAALGFQAGAIAVDQQADLVAVDLDSPRLAGADSDDLLPSAVFAATAADVTAVVASGRLIVRDRRHLLIDDVPRQLTAAIEAVMGR